MVVRDFIRQNCVAAHVIKRPIVPPSKHDFIHRLRFSAKLAGMPDLPNDECILLTEHRAYKALSEMFENIRPMLEQLPGVGFEIASDWRFGQIMFSSAMPAELVERQLPPARVIGIEQTILFEREHLIHALFVRQQECTPLWFGLHALQTFWTEWQRRQSGFDEMEQMADLMKQMLGAKSNLGENSFQIEGDSYRLLMLLLHHRLAGLLIPIIDSFAISNNDDLAGLVEFIMRECERDHGGPLSEAEKKLRELMVRNVVLVRKVPADKLAAIFGLVAK